jgi:hypothetical protein
MGVECDAISWNIPMPLTSRDQAFIFLQICSISPYFHSHPNLWHLSIFPFAQQAADMTLLSNLGIVEIDTVSDDDGSSGSDTAMYGGEVEIVPQDADVLLGRGTKHQHHPGNMRYNGKA